ncbi:tetratricopeptide repeat protein [Cellvibrio sp. pealriver]|uniref:tetratricopeptide repeat protein n=1 Tax=Cellvibrio sp. pealriver TaxID=1622269 RepID=UPI000AFD8EE0|nr:SEL1-like repeat protein [Cellvibrio sp. pealriver]
MENSIREKAEALLEEGELVELYALLAPYLEQGDGYAQFLYSSFSLESLNETEDEFEARSMQLLNSASEAGVAEASYRLGVIYLYGDFVENNSTRSSDYFERAIAQGHSHSKFTYGFNLYYGVGDVQQDKTKGLKLLQEAAQEGIALAADELNMINAKK